jgi:uncharacterized protein YbjQ (UPF0145 family)
MDDVKIFTTPILDGIRILEYKEPLIVRNVRAMSIIHDLMTRVRDIVGGRSGAYQDVMKKIEDEVIEEIKAKAAEQGANAIVGFNLDFDSIDGLLMGCAQGTAVVIENNS